MINVVVGQTVALWVHRVVGAPGTYRFGNVTRITPSGQVVVLADNGDEVKFNKRGASLSSSRYWKSSHINVNVEKIQDFMQRRENSAAAAKAINAVRTPEFHATNCKDHMLAKIEELEKLLAAAKAAVAACAD